jgi:molybdenum cofactor cytidylyltransferase
VSATEEVVAVILAAGASSRLGQPKQLLVTSGRTLVRAIVEEARAICARVAAVVGEGAAAAAVEATLEGSGATLVRNAASAEGMASSVRAGVGWAAGVPCEAALILVCDQPRLTRVHLAQLVAAWRRERRAVGSGYDGVIGVPALFPRCLFPRLLALRGREGARSVLRNANAIQVAWPDGALDVDTPADLTVLCDVETTTRARTRGRIV